MRHTLLILSLALLGLVLPASAQNRAAGKLYTRVEGNDVRVALQIEIDSTWKLYHTDLGHPDAIAEKLTYAFEGVDGEWSELLLLDPETEFVDNPALGQYTVDYHKGKAIGFARGLLAEGESIDDLELMLKGQTCDPQFCVPYSETISSSGEGPDALWESFPEALAAQAAGGSGAGEDGQAEGFDWEPEFTPGIRADARLQLLTDGKRVRARVEVAVDDTWHLYNGPTIDDVGPNGPAAAPTVIEVIEAGPVLWEDPVYPETHGYPALDEDLNDIEVRIIEGRAVFTLDGELEPGADPEDLLDVVMEISGQTCDASGCIPWDQELTYLGDEIAMVDVLPALVAPASHDGQEGDGPGAEGSTAGAAGDDLTGKQDEEEGDSLLSFLLQAVMWGFITLLMPCTYPMIPITISFFTKQADQRDGNVLPLSLAYGAGIVGMFVLIGVVVGPPIQAFANHPLFNLLVAGMFIFFALVLFGWINLQPPAFLTNAAGKASSTGGIVGVFLMGLTLVITSFTCTAPFVGTLLASGANQGVGRTALGMGLFGMTMALPFVMLSLFPGRMKKMPTAGAWMNTLKVFLGFVELAASLKFLSTADLGWGWGVLSKEVFLLAWGAIFLVAAAFLFGWINLKGEEDGAISPGRMVGATATFVFATYSLFLIGGYKMDPLMTAFAPPYSTAPARAAGVEGPKTHSIVKDDYDTAVSQAKAEKKALLVNITGYN